jgi:hypothetical protein
VGGSDRFTLTLPSRFGLNAHVRAGSVSLYSSFSDVLQQKTCRFSFFIGPWFILPVQLASAYHTSAPPSHAHSATCRYPQDHVAAKDNGQNPRILPSVLSRPLPFSRQESARRARGLAHRYTYRASGTIGMYTPLGTRGRVRAVQFRFCFSNVHPDLPGRLHVGIILDGAGLVYQ